MNWAGNLKLEQFEHIAEYTEDEGVAKSFLQSTCDQEVGIDDDVMNDILEETDFSILDEFMDSQRFFIDYILEIQ